MGNNCCSEPREGKDKKVDIKNVGKLKKGENEMSTDDLEKSIQEKKALVDKLKAQLKNDWDNTDSMKKQRNEDIVKVDSIEDAAKKVNKIAELETDNDTDRSPKRSPRVEK